MFTYVIVFNFQKNVLKKIELTYKMKISLETEDKMSFENMKQEKISSDELQQFYDSLSNNLHTKCDFTIGKM